VADTNQYLRLTIGGQLYLLPSVLRYTVESRDVLVENPDPASRVVAWRDVRTARWPAYGVDGLLRATRAAGWARAMFLEGANATVGLTVDDAQLMPRGEVQVSPFTPLGPVPTRLGHLFSGAWVRETQVMLVFEPSALIAYLQSLGS
jgi:hypothetical protein